MTPKDAAPLSLLWALVPILHHALVTLTVPFPKGLFALIPIPIIVLFILTMNRSNSLRAQNYCNAESEYLVLREQLIAEAESESF